VSRRNRLILILASLLASSVPSLGARPTHAEEALVAVASNFAGIAHALEADFERATEHELRITTGSTGKLFAQIVHGAPYDVFLAADRARPSRLVDEGYAIESSRRTYASGRLALVSKSREAADLQARLSSGAFNRLAIANPDLAPYGRAAMEVLAKLGLAERAAPRLVMGENIGQTYALAATGNADLAFVSTSQLRPADRIGSLWRVPAELHAPIRQDVVLLVQAKENEAALAFLTYLDGPAARAKITAAGYEVE